MFPSHGSHRPARELLSLKEIMENDNAPEKNSLSAVSHLAQVSAAKETAASQRAALISHQHLHVPVGTCFGALQGEDQRPEQQLSPAAVEDWR